MEGRGGSPGSLWAAGSASSAAPTASRPTTWSARGWCWPLNVFGASTGGEPEASDLLGALAELAGLAPASTVMTPAPCVPAKRYLAHLGDEMASASLENAHNRGRSEYFDVTLPGEVVAALVRNLDADRRPGQARELDFTPWVGAYTRVPVGATAFPRRDTGFLLKHTVAVAADASSRDRETACGWLHHSWAIVHPCGSSGVYPYFPTRTWRPGPTRTTVLPDSPAQHRAAAGGSRGRAAARRGGAAVTPSVLVLVTGRNRGGGVGSGRRCS
jgi:hypothetical protein